MRLVFKLAWRSLWRNKRRTWITVSSISLGLAFALFMLALADGMYKKLVDQAIRMGAGHITLEHPDYENAPSVDKYISNVDEISAKISTVRGIERLKPTIIGQAVVSTGNGSAGVAVFAVDPEDETATSFIPAKILAGRYLKASDTREVVLGSSLAKRLKLKPGKKMVLTSNDSKGNLVNELLKVKGIFKTGMEEADGFLVQVTLDTGRRIFHLPRGTCTRLCVMLHRPDDLEETVEKISGKLEGTKVAVRRWQEVLPDLAAYISVDKGSNIVFQVIILFIIGFTILNTVLMSVLERKREFAAVIAIGTSPRLLKAQVVLESAMIGLLGCILGLAVGGSISYYVELNGLDLSAAFSQGASVAGYTVDPVIRSDLTIGLMAWLGLGVFSGTTAIGLYPAYKSGKVDVTKTLREI